jgi:peptidoglycan/xylan/chitin deacetylase (PgdA/CDA1 family)
MPTRIALIFDDGFARSSAETAGIFESFGLRAVFAVLADPKGLQSRFPAGDFPLWNELAARGHHIHPHGLIHSRLPDLPHQTAVDQIRQGFDRFQSNLNGFDSKKTVYHFTYNLSTPALVDFLLPGVAAVRTSGTGFLTQAQIDSRIWPATSFGPDDPCKFLMTQLNSCDPAQHAGFIFNLHGLDGEGWGATSTDHLKQLLDFIQTNENLQYWPVP